jgi:hypothetical protein
VVTDGGSHKSDRKKGETGSRRTRGSSSVLRNLGTGLSVQRTEDIAYRIAVINVQDSQEYQKLKEVCRNPFKPDENYQWLVEFIKRRAGKFWQYLQYRESGKKDKDLIRAASILEYSRLLAGLVKNHPEFEGRFTGELVKQNPVEFRGKKPYTPAEFVEKLTRHNEKDYLGIDPPPEQARPGNEPSSPVSSGKSLTPVPEIMTAYICEDICECLELYVAKNLPQFKGFIFDSKCSLLTRLDWINIVDEFRKRHAELKGMPIGEVIDNLPGSVKDPKPKEIAKHLKQYKI